MTQSVSKQASYNFIDLFKFLMAFCVVAIHTEPLINCNNIVVQSIYDSIVRCAVPFFFLASGFLLERKCDGINDQYVIKNQIKKILKMYLLWSLIYLPLELLHALSVGTPLLIEMLLYIRGLLFIGQHYNSWPLWYLLSTMYALLLVGFLKKKSISVKGMMIISIVIMFISFGIDYFVSINELSGILFLGQKLIKLSIINGRILQGLFFIPFGMILADYKKVPLPIICLLFGFIGNCLFDGLLGSLFLVLSAIGLFELILKGNLPDKPLWKYCRECSTIIYLIHMYVWTFYYVFVYGEKTYGIDSFVFTSIVSFVISVLYLFARYKRKENHT